MILQGRNLTQGLTGADVGTLQSELTTLGYSIPATEQQGSSFGAATLAAVEQFQTAQALTANGTVDATTAAALTTVIAASTYAVTGTVSSATTAGVGGLAVQLVDKNVGGDISVATTTTAGGGSYAISVVISPATLRARHKTRPDLQARVMTVAANGARTFLATSSVAYNTGNSVTLNVALPANATGLPSEYETLTASLATLYPGALADLKENATQQDVTFLANKAGWDARAVAVAALAGQFSQITAPAPIASAAPAPAPAAMVTAATVAPQSAAAAPLAPQPEIAARAVIQQPPGTVASPVPAPASPAPAPAPAPATVSLLPEFYYALFRAGLPANADLLFQTGASTVQAIWSQAIAQGVIPQALASQVPQATQVYQALSAAHTLTMAPSVGVSTLQALVAPILTSTTQQTQFAELLAQYSGDWVHFWPAVQTALGATASTQLQLLGQLHFLTLNNAPLVAALTKAEAQTPLTSPADLASRGYYEATKWTPLIGTAIPAGVPGATPAEQTSAYAALLAAQVRIAYPTAVLADQVERGVMPIADTTDTANEVATFLATNQAQFTIGAEPVQAFIARTKVAEPSAPALAQIKRLQRVYQLTPDDTSMSLLLRHNLDSAYAITRYDSAGFVRAFQAQLGGAATAKAIHKRAKQVFGSVLNMAASWGVARVGPNLGGGSHIIGGPPSVSTPGGNSVIASATLETLFSSLDYCNCSDCNSILSPPAYLVDLLHYIDQPAPSPNFSNPQDALFVRRPDLQYLPLTCENTNTALPYIDIVNETLEYFVANNLSLANYQGHDTGSTSTSAELLASPQYVNDTAYAALQTAFFPLPLPFNRPLALLRLQLQNLGTDPPDAMIALRANDTITVPANAPPMSYGWSDILIEQLGMSRDEYRLFTDSSLQLGDLYGLPRATGQTTAAWNAAVLATLQTMNLQTFCKRIAVSYVDLTSILQTQFINPSAALLPMLQALNAPFSTIQTLHDNLNTAQTIAPQFIAALPAGLDATPYGGQSPTDYQAVVTWVTGTAVYPLIMSLITIANPTGAVDDCTGTALQLRYANPDNTKNELNATDLLKLVRFVRLWQKLQPSLGDPDDAVTIAQTDAILATLYPAADLPVQSANTANDPTNRPLLDAGFGVALMRTGFLFQIMNRLSLTADDALAQLLACWAPIGRVGPQALYQSMFLTPTLLQQDPGAQTATVSNAISAGDVLTTQINTVSIPYTVTAGQTASTVATQIAAAINATTTQDPVSGEQLNQRFVATAQTNVIVIMAGFALACSVSGGATETLTAAGTNPLSRTATVGGTVTAGDTLTTTIDTVPIGYTVVAGDTPATIAAGIAAAINGTTLPHPYSGFALNTIVAASSAGAVVTIATAGAGPSFDLACSLTTSGSGGGYVTGAAMPAGYTLTVNGTIKAGDILVTTIKGIQVPYTAVATDTTSIVLAASIATAINSTVLEDPTTSLPLSSLVHATAAQNVATLNPIDPATAFTVTSSVTTGSETYVTAGPTAASQTATVTGSIPAGSVLTTTIDELDIFYTVAASDTATTIATNIAASINTSTGTDPVSNLPLTSVVKAAASGGLITVTAVNPTTAFTLTVTVTAASYTAGRLSPPFAATTTGAFLTDQTQKLFGHEPLLCAAFNLTGADFALICTALGFDGTTPLTLDKVSAVFRYGWLAHTLGLSVLVFLRLCEFSGLSQFPALYPFAPLDLAPTTPAEPPVIRFIRLLQAMNTAGLQPVQALYLIWNQDLSGTSAPTRADITSLALGLSADFAAVEAQFTLQDDPSGAIAQSLMALVYGATVTGFFFGLLNNTFSVAVPHSYASPSLPQTVIDASGGLLDYDDLGKQLSLSGVLNATTQAAIAAAAAVHTSDSNDNIAAGPASMANIVPGTVLAIDSGAAQETVVVATTTATSFTTTTANTHNGTTTPFAIVNDSGFTAALASLEAASQQATAPFFATYPELLPLYAAYAASTAPLQTRRTNLLASFLPTLKRIRKEEQALASITAAVGSDPSFASALLQDPTILHADIDPTAPAVSDLTAIETSGLTAQFYRSNNPAAAPDQTVDAVAPVWYVQTATISGTVTAGVVLTTTINGIAIAYTTTAADTSLAILAGNVAAAINAGTAIDASSGLPINRLVSAATTTAGNVIAISGSTPMAANSLFSLTCSVPAGALTYVTASQLPPGTANGPIAGVWTGYITVPQNGDYNFAVVADSGATVALEIGGTSAVMSLIGGVWRNQNSVTLVAGALTPIVLSARSIKTTLSLSWQSPPGLGWQIIPGQYLYPFNLVQRLGDTYVRFLKATTLASALSLVADEIAWLGASPARTVDTACALAVAAGSVQFTPQSMANIAVGSVLAVDTGPTQEALTVTAISATAFTAVAVHAHDGTVNPFPIVSQAAPDVGRGWLNFLPGGPDADPIAAPSPDLPTAARLAKVLGALLDFSRIKQALSPSDERLLQLLQSPAAILPSGQSALISLTGWAQVSVNALLTRFFNSLSPVSLGDIENFARVYDTYQIVQTCRVTASTLLVAVSNTPTATSVSTLQSALRALYAEADWLTVVKPINDAIRILQRDALVAYILQGFANEPAPISAINTPDKLYEYFLIDPETQPPVETSRIRLALSTVQLFIERILRNLEPEVSPGDIDATQCSG